MDTLVGERTVHIQGDGTRATFAFADGTRIELAGSAAVRLSEQDGKELLLQYGTLLAAVSPQLGGLPLRVQTPAAEAVVLGTSFVINAAEAETFLRVNSGDVELRGLVDNQAFKVAAHEQAYESTTATQPIAIEPVSAGIKAYNKATNTPEAIDRGYS